MAAQAGPSQELSGIVQYWQVLKQLRIVDPAFTALWLFAMVMAILLLIIGTFGFLALLI